MNKQKVVIIGAGPAGLTATYELLKHDGFEVVLLEETNMVGGISRTVNYKGNRMDMGGHRFFSKAPEVNAWWDEMLPMMKRNRLSRIFFNQKFFDYPITLKVKTLKNLGFGTTVVIGFSYLKSAIFKRKEESLEDFYINRFGKKLYSLFFENYTENLWGRHPREISPEWGAQRVKGLSITTILKDIFGKKFKRKGRKVETSLIEEFLYPKYGPGEMWETVAQRITARSGKIIFGAKAVKVRRDEKNNVTAVVYQKDGKNITIKCGYVISTMPVKDLVEAMDDVPEKYAKIANGLPYRSFKTVGVLCKGMALGNKHIIPDNWVYVHDRSVKMGRFQVFNNWSPYLVKNPKTVWLGLEYFCDEGDDFWNMKDEDFAALAIDEMLKLGLIKSRKDVLDFHVESVKKAYPAYFDTYNQFGALRNYLDKIPNLYLIGRNGQHHYNNMDHSMCTAFEAVKNILSGKTEKTNIWNVNTEKDYHELKK